MVKRKLSIREAIYKEDIGKAARMSPGRKLALALELSDFCRYLQSRVSAHDKGKK